MASGGRSRAISHGMARDELFLLWEGTVKERELSVPNPTSALEGALTIRCVFAVPLFGKDRRKCHALYEERALLQFHVSCRHRRLEQRISKGHPRLSERTAV